MVEEHSPFELLQGLGDGQARVIEALVHLFDEINKCVGIPSATHDAQK